MKRVYGSLKGVERTIRRRGLTKKQVSARPNQELCTTLCHTGNQVREVKRRGCAMLMCTGHGRLC
jgi:hypothetical protein